MRSHRGRCGWGRQPAEPPGKPLDRPLAQAEARRLARLVWAHRESHISEFAARPGDLLVAIALLDRRPLPARGPWGPGGRGRYGEPYGEVEEARGRVPAMSGRGQVAPGGPPMSRSGWRHRRSSQRSRLRCDPSLAFDKLLFASDPATLAVVCRSGGPDSSSLAVVRPNVAHLSELPHQEALEWCWSRFNS